MLVAETLAKKKSLAIELHHISVRKIREMILFSTCFLPCHHLVVDGNIGSYVLAAIKSTEKGATTSCMPHVICLPRWPILIVVGPQLPPFIDLH
jgi:hypothetical protein